ncbi:hypothetical protein [Dyadobacter bucti]|uniref:hypothetical protein n=1 Tax=Dyadobacter bucti TaxID=2572203 RepID=UPI001109733B|nr:hypothetical protein [Dyadobacter bucti]
MKFDPKTHQFGMAYAVDNYVLYIGTNISMEWWYYSAHYKDGHRGWCDVRKVKRAPEHDLISVAVADKLAEALKFYSGGLHYTEFREFPSDARITIIKDRGEVAAEALTEYEAYKNVSRGDL